MLIRSFRLNRHRAAVAIVFGLIAATATAQTTPPAVAFMQPSTANAGDPALTLSITGAGFLTGSVAYWGTQALPTTIQSANQISASVRADLLGAAGQFAVSVANPGGARSILLPFQVFSKALSITTTALPPAQAGVAYSETLTAAGGTAPHVWSAIDTLPAGLTLAHTGQLSGTPSAAGSFTFTVRATDAAQGAATGTLTLTVAAPPFSIGTAATLPSATEGIAYSQVLRVENGTAPFQWSAGSALPAGITLNASTGALSGTPATRGSYSFSIQVTGSGSASATKTFSLIVQTPPLVITTVSPLFAGVVGSAYSQSFSATGGTLPYAWTMRQQVTGLTLDRTTGSLAGTPDQAAAYTLTIQVNDSTGATISRDFTLTVEQPQLLITNSSTLPPGTVGTAHQQRFLATGGKSPYLWSITSASVPGLVQMDAATGILSSTPSDPGTFAFSVTVRDSANATSTRAFSLTIAAGPLRLTSISDTLQNAIGNPFAISLSASGGTPLYTWSANGLPEGLEIDAASGAVSGIFRTVGSFLFTIRVTDAARVTATELVSVNVIAPALPGLRAVDMPDTAAAANQIGAGLELSEPYSLPLTGQLTLSFAPEAATGDPAVQFSTGGRTVDFQIPAGALQAQFPVPSIGLQTGTVAGTITLSARLQTQGLTLTPTPITIQTIRINQTAPAITSATFARTGSTIEVRITGYSTSREITQGTFRFRASGTNTLTISDVNLALEETFGRWFRDSSSTQYGGQYTFAQQFTIQGDVNAVIPVSATLTNRVGSTTANIRE